MKSKIHNKILIISSVFILLHVLGCEKPEENIPWGVKFILGENHNFDTSQDIKIAIIDTGINNHKEFRIDGGISFTDSSYNTDNNGHGTHMAGIIKANNNNGGIRGINPNCKIYSVKAVNKNQKGSYENIIKGINWSIQNDMDIILMSFGGTTKSKKLKKAIDHAYSRNIYLISSAGNTGLKGNYVTYPARYNNVLAVGAIDKEENKWIGSVGNKSIIMAPGKNIVSTINTKDYKKASGTSMAAAHIAGLVSILKSKNPNLTNKDITIKLYNNAKYKNGMYIINGKKVLENN